MSNASTFLAVGVRVRWTSMSQGHTKTKEGVIEAVIPAGGHPRVYSMVPRNQLLKFGGVRGHESYLVRVRKSTFYWPLAKNLTVVKDDLSTTPPADVTPETVARALMDAVRAYYPAGDYYSVGVDLANLLLAAGASLQELIVAADTIKGDIRKALQAVRGKG